MKNLDLFTDAIELDIGWRKKELSNLLLMYNDSNKEIVIKASILLLYSHWEGYIKNICKLYLEFVSSQSLKLVELNDNFKAISLKGRISEVYKSSSTLTMKNELNFLELIKDDSNKTFKLKINFKKEKDKSIINTEDNLSFGVFTSFQDIIGIGEKECLKTKKMYIDNKLLNSRNKIAHGSKIDKDDNEIDLSVSSFKILKRLVLTIMSSMGDDVKAYAEAQFYLEKNNSKSEEFNMKSNNVLKRTLNDMEID